MTGNKLLYNKIIILSWTLNEYPSLFFTSTMYPLTVIDKGYLIVFLVFWGATMN